MKKAILSIGLMLIVAIDSNAQKENSNHSCFEFEHYNKTIVPGLNDFNQRIYTTYNSAILIHGCLCEHLEYVELFKQGVIEATMFYQLDIVPKLDNSDCHRDLMVNNKDYGIEIESIKLLEESSDKKRLKFEIIIGDPSIIKHVHTIHVEIENLNSENSDRFDLFCKGTQVKCMKFITTNDRYY
jgi:hypothetical protein